MQKHSSLHGCNLMSLNLTSAITQSYGSETVSQDACDDDVMEDYG